MVADLSIYVPELLRLLRLVYPDWKDFSHAQFVEDEIDYKREASAFAREKLDREALTALLDASDYDGFLARLKAVAGKTNLLYMGTPSKGDLALIKREGVDPGPICRAVFDLLHGDGDAADRLEAFSGFIDANGHPQRWTFATYYLFLLYPEREIFVKPGVTEWLSKFTGGAIPYESRPNGKTYAAIRDGFSALGDAIERAIAPAKAQNFLKKLKPGPGIQQSRPDMIEVQSVVYVAHQVDTKGQPYLKAIETLQRLLADVRENDNFRAIEASRDEVYTHFGPLFASDHLPELTAEEFASFLDFKNNHHWSGIDQHVGLVTGDMPALRVALGGLLDESRSLAEAFDAAQIVKGLGKARITAFLHVANPEQYGVWNSKSEQGLRQLGIYPSMKAKATEGQHYEAVNDTLLWLAEALKIDLWTLDMLWEWLTQTSPAPQKLAPPFDKIFADRAQAEWAFDLFADAVERLGGGPDDPRFALTRYDNPPMLRLNIGNSMVIDIGNRGQRLNLTALKKVMEQSFDFGRPGTFRVTSKGTAQEFGVYTIPAEFIRKWPQKLQSIFERSMEEFGKEFESWERSNLRRAHTEEIFAAMFDKEKRDHVLTQGLKTVVPPLPLSVSTIADEFKGFTPDAFAFLRDLADNNNKAWMDANRERWKTNVLEPMRALFTDLGPHVKRLFDPYLLPDELEIAPKANKVLARINKDRAATPDSKYYEHYWGAFYRNHLKRQSDAHLFVALRSGQITFGSSFGDHADEFLNRFHARAGAYPEDFYSLVSELGLSESFDFIHVGSKNQRDEIQISEPADLVEWLGDWKSELSLSFTPEEVVAFGPALADHIYDAFRRVFPIYLWAVADDYKTVTESYLEKNYPDGDEDDIDPTPQPYTFTDFTQHTHLTDADAADLRDMLLDKRQAILYGPPGTGKTFVARHLGRLITELADPPPERLTIIQFHPAYGYEEFIEGIRPKGEKDESGRTTVDYPVRPGIFVRFCREAERVDGPCVFIIDEINRGNIPRIFGELMYLLEYRDETITLPYSGDRFRIPRNVYLIGTMNTADRSIALVDFALRRRFHFAHLRADPDLFGRWLKANPPTLPWLGVLYERLAAEAIDDPDYAIGPSVFMRPGLDEAGLRRVWAWSVMPLLREYHLDNKDRAERWEWDGPEMRRLRGAADGGEGDA